MIQGVDAGQVHGSSEINFMDCFSTEAFPVVA